MILVDSSVWIDYFNGVASPETNYLDDQLDQQIIQVGDIILVEVLQGFREDQAFDSARRALMTFEQVEMLNQNLAVQCARNYRSLRKMGVTVRKTIDCMIATYCLETDTPVLHCDRDFDPFEQHLGLRVIHP
jgi:predicted nucleic acid-binding protein